MHGGGGGRGRNAYGGEEGVMHTGGGGWGCTSTVLLPADSLLG
jgi:hypothetical protein